MGTKSQKKAADKKEKSNELKQELDIDFHKISKDELYERFQTNPERVNKFYVRVK